MLCIKKHNNRSNAASACYVLEKLQVSTTLRPQQSESLRLLRASRKQHGIAELTHRRPALRGRRLLQITHMVNKLVTLLLTSNEVATTISESFPCQMIKTISLHTRTKARRCLASLYVYIYSVLSTCEDSLNVALEHCAANSLDTAMYASEKVNCSATRTSAPGASDCYLLQTHCTASRCLITWKGRSPEAM
jgi:hypothetical protein